MSDQVQPIDPASTDTPRKARPAMWASTRPVRWRFLSRRRSDVSQQASRSIPAGLCVSCRAAGLVGSHRCTGRRVLKADAYRSHPTLKRRTGSVRRRFTLQREEPVGAGGRTHGVRHQADVRFGCQRWPERQQYVVQLTSTCGWAGSLFRRLLPCRAKWHCRPLCAGRNYAHHQTVTVQVPL